MSQLPGNHTNFYDDGPWWPQTPEQQAAYRDAFLASARQAANWTKVDEAAIQAAWDERRRAREQAVVLIPSSVYFNDPRLDSEQVTYRAGHLVEASRTRGRVHGFEFVRQCWEELVKAGVDEQRIGPEIITPWLAHVGECVCRDIDPERISPTPQCDTWTQGSSVMRREGFD